jgi:2-(1,2-epoxy-1,2-dihydrophenyl)acetyl-CoA isomerase
MVMVRLSTDGPVGTITLARPERSNSLVPDLLEEFLSGFRALDVEPAVRCIVLAAEGATFSTGGDIEAIRRAAERHAYAARLVGLLNQVIVEVCFAATPVVAAVHGMVTGGSLGFLVAADVVVMASEATIRPWYATVGFAPDGGWTALLPSLIGHRRALETLVTDAVVTPEQALAWGLAHRVVPVQVVGEVATSIARDISGGKAGALAAARRLVRGPREAVVAALEAERDAFLELVVGEEATSGMDAFLEGRLR